MESAVNAVIFDMDGVLIDSEHLWRRAMIKGFTAFGMPVTEEQCRRTMGMRIGEVISIWMTHFQVKNTSGKTVEEKIISELLALIAAEGKFIPGIPEILAFCKENKIRTGLATSSSELLMKAVLDKLGIAKDLEATVSAEHLKYAKPHPEVFLLCAEKLSVPPQQCLVIEDSLNGVIAAKAAQMKVIAVPDDEHTSMGQFALADHKFNSMTEVYPLLTKIFK